jgi:hemolysin III
MSHHHHGDKADPKFSVTLFAITVVVTVAGLFGTLALVAPTLWKAQLAAPWWMFAAVFVTAHFAGGVFEYFFHRYILHAPLIPFLSYFYKQHTLHHALTRVGFQKSRKGRESIPCLVENHYPIEHEKQFEASYFPWYTLASFSLFASPVFAVAQWVFPAAPVFLAGFAGLAWSLCLYEIVHAIEHLPQATWDRLVAQPKTGAFWRKAYAFHLRHHADIRCNEGISGFFALPVVDLLLGTYVDPETLYTHGQTAEPKEFISPRPRFAIIRWLDHRAEQSIKRRRQRHAATEPAAAAEEEAAPVIPLGAVARSVTSVRSVT